MAGADRISALPEETKVFILSLLSFTDAVRTSVLSRSWRYLWTFLQHFNFDLDFGEGPVCSTEDLGRLLSSLRGPIFHFSLQCFLLAHQSSCVQHFLDLLFQKDGLGNLCVHCGGTVPQVLLPSFRLLKDLDLQWIDIILPDDFAGFEQLTSLKLHSVCISQTDMQSLIDGSKKLMSIELSFERLFTSQEDAAGEQPCSVIINCPLLKYLRFDFGEVKVEPQIISAPCLENVYVSASADYDFTREEFARVGAAALKFMPDIAHVWHLSLNFEVLMCLSKVDVPRTLRVHFRQLQCLKLIGPMYYVDERMFQVLHCLIRSMPFLENLELQCHEPPEYVDYAHNLHRRPLNEYKKEDGYLCLDQTVRRVAISVENLRVLKDLMWMINFILLNANFLEVMKITYYNDESKVESRMLKELCAVEKASTDARVVFVNMDDVSVMANEGDEVESANG
ncbi:FBD-associated F-box protein [Rhynchospora pubera]|uniref:FBD-associated F-box protein n=1 Tax=Rhynchospora pubera TaxID=906938 RepID=A0AAV8FYH8_9POAL|nr:FBD-associated F-box protein [Rhynchospora pubera]KAJ4796839.1 FBD-associated F-box protein [Rhynchospora pubera]